MMFLLLYQERMLLVRGAGSIPLGRAGCMRAAVVG